MANSYPVVTLATLKDHKSANPLTILHLAEPIISSSNISTLQNKNPIARQPDGSSIPSNSDFESPTPQSLNADLVHYKDLFSKLRFSYLEQVTKEKYLRSIVGDPPLLVSHADNLLLEEKLAGMKSDLKAKKAEVDELVKEIEIAAIELARKYEKVQLDTLSLQELPAQVEELQMRIEEIKKELVKKQGIVQSSSDPRMNMGLENTNKATDEQRRRNEELDQQIEALQRQMPSKTRECEKAHRELEELERRRNETTKLAKEVRRIKEEGGRDTLEEQGKWYRSSEIVLKGLLDVQG